MEKSNRFIDFASFIAGALLVAGLILPFQALASVPRTEPLKMRDMTLQEKETFNRELVAEFKLLDRELKEKFGTLIRKVSVMGFYKGERDEETSLERTTR